MEDEGSGAVLALALLAAVVIVGLAVLGLGSALVVRQRVIAAADAAALAAADSASGAVAGDPCHAAERVAAANRARLIACRIDGLVATVEVSAPVGIAQFRARSTAAPPP